jgi:uncharacterized membrane protein HdeD (DUF308 family)
VSTSVTLARQVSRPSVILSIVMIAAGLLCIALPVATSFGVVLVVAWLLIVHGVVQFIHAFQFRGIGHIVWKILVAALCILAGFFLLAFRGFGLTVLTLGLGLFFVVEGVLNVVFYLFVRKYASSVWLLIDGIVTLILGIMICSRWPFSSLWVIGMLVGVSLLMNGLSRLMMSLAIRESGANPGGEIREPRAA